MACPGVASDAAPEEVRVAARVAASEADLAVASDAAPEEVRVADRVAASEADPAAASDADRAQTSDAARAEARADVRADRNACCRAAALARRDAVRSRYGQVRWYPGCCRRGNSRTNLQ